MSDSLFVMLMFPAAPDAAPRPRLRHGLAAT